MDLVIENSREVQTAYLAMPLECHSYPLLSSLSQSYYFISCPRCKLENESMLHYLRDCPLAQVIWQRLNLLASLMELIFLTGSSASRINCDASRFTQDDEIGFGYIIRDWNGSWKCGCMGILSPSSVLHGELFAIWRGLLLAWDTGFQEATCVIDCYEAQPWRVEMVLIQRDANAVADAMAKHVILRRV
ncbi:hypothetical protein PIB30_054367 [Stylosanthes scabra]|uniref:RNase H type-1 domain-containing protein n=1 Tax=Stylosanthes scabra TaxID=79078 RepID=A0ABU6QJ65_9FABA|nr:hypothetical protein [Stylosanthes scabra]